MRVEAPAPPLVTTLATAPTRDTSVAQAAVGTASPAPEQAARDALKAVERLRIAQFNVENLFDTQDDPKTEDPVVPKEAYEHKLAKLAVALRDATDGAHLIALQEIENEQTLRDLASRPELKDLGYEFAVVPGNDRRGINVGLLYRRDFVKVDKVVQSDVKAPDGAWWARPGGKLYSRPPLMVDVSMLGPGQADEGRRELTLIVNHFKSKIGGDKWNELRDHQAQHVADLVDARRDSEPGRGVLVLGDLNALPGESAYQQVRNYRNGKERLGDATELIPKDDRYTYIYRGQKNQLDHLMFNKPLQDALAGARIPHINSSASDKDIRNPKTGRGASDHDPIVTEWDLSKYTFGARTTS